MTFPVLLALALVPLAPLAPTQSRTCPVTMQLNPSERDASARRMRRNGGSDFGSPTPAGNAANAPMSGNRANRWSQRQGNVRPTGPRGMPGMGGPGMMPGMPMNDPYGVSEAKAAENFAKQRAEEAREAEKRAVEEARKAQEEATRAATAAREEEQAMLQREAEAKRLEEEANAARARAEASAKAAQEDAEALSKAENQAMAGVSAGMGAAGPGMGGPGMSYGRPGMSMARRMGLGGRGDYEPLNPGYYVRDRNPYMSNPYLYSSRGRSYMDGSAWMDPYMYSYGGMGYGMGMMGGYGIGRGRGWGGMGRRGIGPGGGWGDYYGSYDYWSNPYGVY